MERSQPTPHEETLGERRTITGPVRALGGPRVREPWREKEPTLADHAWTLFEERWVVVGLTALCVTAAAVYLLLAAPVYQADAVVQIEDERKTIAGLDDLSRMFGEKTPAEAEIEVIRSRTLVEAVVDELDLDIEATPRAFPVLGGPLARGYRGPGPASPFLGLSRFAWGGEQIQIPRLDVSDDLLDAPMRLTALGEGRYRLTAGELALEGRVGAPAAASHGESRVGMFLSELAARPGTEFRVRKRLRASVVDELQGRLRVSEKGRKTGIVIIDLQDGDPVRVTAVVSALATAYLRQNVERKSAEAAKTLEFLETQLPLLKANLDASQNALNNFKHEKRTVDLSREAETMLTRTAELEKELSALELERVELRQRFTDSHPTLQSLVRKVEKLRGERASLNARMSSLPEAEAESARLVRDVKVANELYLVLLNKAQELKVVKSGTIGNVRIVDQARIPILPLSPVTSTVLLLGLVLGLAGGVVTAVTRRALDEGARDVEEIEARTGLPTYATIPYSDRQREMIRLGRREAGSALPVLFDDAPDDVAIESLRSLRTSLQFALVEAPNNVIAVLGPAPGVGKSFVSVNLAHVLAAPGKSLLLVDADIRRGCLHRHFGMKRRPGLTDVLSGSASLEAAIRPTTDGHIFVLPTGSIPPNPSELLSSHRFEMILKAASRRFEHVVVDTPPLLAVTDASLVGCLAGINLLVLRAGRHPIREIVLALKRLAQGGVRVHGAVLNHLTPSRSGRGRYYYEYPYPPSLPD